MSKTTDIDKLFAQARQSEPYFDNQGFASRVRAQLPAGRKVSIGQETAITVGAAVLGAAVAFPLFPVGEIFALIPSSFTVSVVGLLAASSLISGLAYWLAEHSTASKF
jgi:hypothetical protein